MYVIKRLLNWLQTRQSKMAAELFMKILRNKKQHEEIGRKIIKIKIELEEQKFK